MKIAEDALFDGVMQSRSPRSGLSNRSRPNVHIPTLYCLHYLPKSECQLSDLDQTVHIRDCTKFVISLLEGIGIP